MTNRRVGLEEVITDHKRRSGADPGIRLFAGGNLGQLGNPLLRGRAFRGVPGRLGRVFEMVDVQPAAYTRTQSTRISPAPLAVLSGNQSSCKVWCIGPGG